MDIDAARELAKKTAFLSQPSAYGEPTSRVEAIETHMSWVFLTDTRAYKLKKPFSAGDSPRSSLELRRERCDEEVRLNRRLTENVYLGLSPLLQAPGGYRLPTELLQPGGDQRGNVADWLVTMVRLPGELTLECRIQSGLANRDDAGRAASTLAHFYERAERVSWSGESYLDRLEREVVRYRHELDAPRFPLANRVFLEAITGWQLRFLRDDRELLESRATQSHIVDGHGDLRPEHVFLTPRPAIIDCLEFDRELRLLDAASELAFLALECTRLGAPHIGDELLDTYARVTGDAVPSRLVTFYESHHACIRAVVALWHLDDPLVDTRSKWVRKADSYLGLASRLIQAAAR